VKRILALDQGTTSSRALVFDADGRIEAMAQREFPQLFPKPGWVEHDPRDIWSTQLAVAHEALARAGLDARDVAAIGIANQRETVVLWDRATGAPLANAIVWQDRRTADLCRDLRDLGLEPLFSRRTGLLLDPYFSGTKIRWLLDTIPGARDRARRGELACGTIDTWLVWNLTRGDAHVTDASNASRTLLYSLEAGDWDDELLAALDVPRAILPRIVPSGGVCAHASGSLFGARIPIAGMAGDQQAALFGQMCRRPGMAKNTYGTGCFMLMHTGEAPVVSRNRLLSTAAWDLGRGAEYALEGSVFVAGAAVQWLRDGLGVIERADQVEALAASVPDSGDVYLVPAFTGLGAPHWDPAARGTLIGITRGTRAAHLARAALEGIAFQVADVLFAMQEDRGAPLAELRVDGGAARNDLLLQFQADLLGVPVVRPVVTETTALGAAYLAGLGVGFWDGPGTVERQWRMERTFEPRMPRDAADARLARWREALSRARGWA
jgi:glycerol kinase